MANPVRLATGARLGPYELRGLLGAGGMGEVYKARDTRLDRTVAIKILSEAFADDPERCERFDREARAVAALNHPHICHLHDVGEHDAVRFLVMEHLEGQTLADRLVRGPLPTSDVLRYAVELADALDHAHRRGLVHRDLKPGNVMLTRAGAKLLDFGLSRLQSKPDILALSTISPGGAPLTAEGTVLGTFPYMAPEQLTGREADARSDIFAFGAVVHEMATGRRAFEGATAATVIGAILHTDPPPLSSLQPLAPSGLDRIVSRCLAKDPDDRWQTARDLTLELRWIAEHAAPIEVDRQRHQTWKLVTSTTVALAVLAAAAAAIIVASVRGAPPTNAPVIRMAFSPPDGVTLAAAFDSEGVTISPDGQRLAFVATGPDGKRLLWVRPVESFDAQPLAGTEGGSHPFWSPDSRALGFFAVGKLKKIQAAEGPPQTLCDALQPRGGTWGRSDVIVFAAGAGHELYRVSAGGGTATALPADGFNLERLQPFFLPDGHHFMYSGRPQKFGLFLADLESSAATLMLEGYVGVAYAPPGYLLVVKGTSVGSTAVTLLAQTFDAARLERTGDLRAVADRIVYDTLSARPAVSASENGTLVYGTRERRATRLVWFDRSGTPLGNAGKSGAFYQPALSPDEKTVAVQRIDPETQDSDIWSIDTVRGAESRITSYGNINFNPVWSPDGTRIVFSSARLTPPNLYQKTLSAAGGEQLLLKSTFVDHATDWSPDGRFIVYERLVPKSGWDVMLLPMVGTDGDRKPMPYLQTAFNELDGRVAPGGRWLAYVSDESGTPEVYVRSFPDSGAKRRISTNGGIEPKWRGDGNELFYLAADGALMAVHVKAGAVFEAGAPTALFKTRVARDISFAATYTVTGDGRRFLIHTITEEFTSVPTKIVFNWPAALRR